MTRWKSYLSLGVLASLVTGCSLFGQPSPTRPAPTRQRKTPTVSLQSYFPQKIGASWIYDGFAEYGHRMVLTSIVRESRIKRTIHEISGNVADMSDGESNRNFHFKIRYIFTPNAVREEILEADTPFPHSFKKLTILKLPLRKGARWRQTVMIKGKNAVLRAEIIDIRMEPSIKAQVVRVRYRVPMVGMPNGIYEEVREFANGMGIYRFEKTFGPNSTDQFNYFLLKVIQPAKYTDSNFRVSFLYPSDWKKVEEHRYEGYGGFFLVSALKGPKTVEEAARQEASHRLNPYGTNPMVQRISLRGRDARLIMPSKDQAREMKRQAALIVRYPRSVKTQNKEEYDFLIIYADTDHIRLIARTLEFMR